MPLPRLLASALLLASFLLAPSSRADEPDPVGQWPLRPPPAVVRGFDPPAVVWGSGHRGVDLLGGFGQAVHAALAGRVSFAGRLAGRGVVVVDHGETRTTYEPVSASVEVGARVEAGAVLGLLALAGSHCLPRACLHWGWRRGETYLDPMGLVGARPVRLLPLWRDQPVDLTSATMATTGRVAGPTPPTFAYASVLARLARLARAPTDMAQARGCACS
jgi:murein DD-endopeptidase MepM/ murein hydrolase activator NlpD